MLGHHSCFLRGKGGSGPRVLGPVPLYPLPQVLPIQGGWDWGVGTDPLTSVGTDEAPGLNEGQVWALPVVVLGPTKCTCVGQKPNGASLFPFTPEVRAQ
jgi:hypothetical protein